MTGYVIDASVAVKWLVTEEHSDDAARLLDGHATLTAPELIFAEAANALWAMRRRGDFGREDLREAIDALADVPVVPATIRDLAASAVRLAVDLDHPVYDCFYLSLSMRAQYPVVTADRRFLDKVRGHPYLADHILHIGDLP
ncbi:MAG TPA: type II toxin-antitoxin system VapC family toxin [Woeseiaceae bacterium]|nr:type II toxin-antitoxin system VapC family toxin [Woeseiaceae bacterium]